MPALSLGSQEPRRDIGVLALQRADGFFSRKTEELQNSRVKSCVSLARFWKRQLHAFQQPQNLRSMETTALSASK
jgi:hypothetical protein